MHAVVRRLLEAAGLAEPDGRPLCAYPVTPEDVSGLEASLRARLERGATLDREDAAALLLYAAERFCDAYREGPWTWETALDGLEVAFSEAWRDEIEWAATRFWGVEIVLDRRGRRQLLTTVACQGGLPRALLARPDAHLGRWLAQLLRRRARVPRSIATEELVEASLPALPRGLRRREVVHLAAGLVDGISALRALHPEACAALEPLEALRAVGAPLERSLPLRLTDEAARRLLRGLFRTPVRRDASALVWVEPSLSGEGDGFTVARAVELDRQITPAALRARFDLRDETELGDWLDLVLVLPTGQGAKVATLSLRGDGSVYDVAPHAVSASLPWGLTVEAGLDVAGARLTAAVDGGGTLTDEPWVFAEEDHGALIGVGATRTRAPAARVLLPAGWTLEGGHATQVGALAHAPECAVWRVEGEAVARAEESDDGGFRVRTAAPEDEPRYELSRRGFVRLGGVGTEVVQGEPELVRVTDDGVRARVHGARVEWSPVGGSGGERAASYGPQWLRVWADGALRVRRRVLRVPTTLRVEVRLPKGNIPPSTVVYGAREVRVERPGLEVTRLKQGWQVARAADAAGSPGEDGAERLLPLWLRLPTGQIPVEVKVPFPEKSVNFTLGGRAVDGAAMALGDLLRLHAEVRDHQDGVWWLTGRVLAGARAGAADAGWTDSRRMDLHLLRRDAVGRHSLAVAEVQALLGALIAAGGRDATVELGIRSDRQHRANVSVREFARELKPIGREEPTRRPTRIELESGGAVAGLSLEIRSMYAGREERTLSPTDETGWAWPEDMPAGVWLCLAWDAEGVAAARPLRVRVRDSGGGLPAAEVGAGPLAAAARVEKDATRMAALVTALEALAGDLLHPEWGFVEDHLDTLDELPPHTFDVNVALARHPGAAAMAAVRHAARSDAALRRLERGLRALSFDWWAVPQACWGAAMGAYMAWLPSASGSSDAGAAGLDPDMGRVVGRLRQIEGVLFSDARALSETELREHWLRAIGRVSWGEHTHARWPDFSPKDLAGALKVDLAAAEKQATALRLGLDNQRVVGLAPFLAARAVEAGAPIAPWPMMALRTLRFFDPRWFHTAFSHAIATLEV